MQPSFSLLVPLENNKQCIGKAKQQASHGSWHTWSGKFWYTGNENFPTTFTFPLQSYAVMYDNENDSNRCGEMGGTAVTGVGGCMMATLLITL